MNISCRSSIELLELIEKLSRLAQSEKLLTAKNEKRERQYLWAWQSMASFAVEPNISQVFQGKGEIIIYDVEIYSGIQSEEYQLIHETALEITTEETGEKQ